MAGDPLQFRDPGQVLRFGEEKYIFREENFCLLICFTKVFLGPTTFLGSSPEVGYEPGEHPIKMATDVYITVDGRMSLI